MATQNQLRLTKALGGDGQRPTKFDAVLMFGFEEDSDSKDLTQDEVFQALMKTQSFPSLKNEPLTYKHKGRTIPVRGNTVYDNTWECTLYMQENHNMKYHLETWMLQLNQQNQTKTDSAIQSQRDMGLYRTINVVQRTFDDMQPVVTYTLMNVYPKNINSVPLDYSGVGQILEMTVEFSYSHFEVQYHELEDNRQVVDKILEAQRKELESQMDNAKSKIDDMVNNSKLGKALFGKKDKPLSSADVGQVYQNTWKPNNGNDFSKMVQTFEG